MFERYGPNSLKVSAYIKALQSMSSELFSTVDYLDPSNKPLKRLAKILSTLKDVRIAERSNAFEDAIVAGESKASNDQKMFVGAIASILVVEDFLTQADKVFVDLFIIHPKIPLAALYADYQKEDEAIEEFCRRLTRMDGQTVYVKTRPDDRGQSGQGLPDFVVHRNGTDITVEHTSLNTYRKQVFYERLFAKFFEPLRIEERIKDAYPKHWVSISIPIDAFKSEYEAKRFDFQRFIENLIEAVAVTPIGRYGNKEVVHRFDNTPFRVGIANDEGFWDCRLIRLVPASRSDVPENLTADIVRAIGKKSRKLHEAKATGKTTVLLLDSDDYALVNWEILAEAFRGAVTNDVVLRLLDDVDQVYIQHRGAGCCWILPVKEGSRVYPALPLFEEYWNRQAEILIGKPPSAL